METDFLTAQERKVLALLVEFWNAYLELPELHSHDKAETMRDVHDLQNRLLARPVVRCGQALKEPHKVART